MSIERTNEFTDVCNLYISAYPVDGQLHIHSRIDASVVGARDSTGLVRLIEAIPVPLDRSPVREAWENPMAALDHPDLLGELPAVGTLSELYHR